MPNNNTIQYKVKANDFEFTFSAEQVAALDLIKKSPAEFHLLKDHHSFAATLVDCDPSAKHQTIEVAGERFDVTIKDELDLVLDQLGFSAVKSKHIKEIKAPMPGLVLEVNVTEGQQVVQGEKILVLVAMKMENSIAIHADATIKRIAVTAGQAVDKGQLLVELD